MKTSKIMTLSLIAIGLSLSAGAPVAYAGHAATSNVAILGHVGHFTVHGKSKHSILKSKEPKHYRVCGHGGSGPILVTHDGQNTTIGGFNCSDFTASTIDVGGVDGASINGTYYQPEHHFIRFIGHQ